MPKVRHIAIIHAGPDATGGQPPGKLAISALAALVLAVGLSSGCALRAPFGDTEASTIEVRYLVTADAQNPLQLQASVDLTPVLGRAQRAHLRARELGLAQQIANPRCDDRQLRSTGDTGWDLPADCRTLSWIIEPREAAPGGTDASAQQTLYFPGRGWWLISEPTSLLHLTGIPGSAIRTLHVEFTGTVGDRSGEAPTRALGRLPATHQAPEFFAIGDVALETREIGSVRVTHVLDDPARIAALSLQELHQQALSYLTDAYGLASPLQSEHRELVVIWLGVEASRGEVGGAAGHRSLVVNYPYGDGATQASTNARTLLLVAHEQAHQLHDLIRGDAPPLSAWMSESLAHYGAFEAAAIERGGGVAVRDPPAGRRDTERRSST